MNVAVVIDDAVLRRVLERVGEGEMMTAIVADVAKTLRNTIVGRTPVGVETTATHFPGTAKKAWTQPVILGEGEVSFSNDLPYICALEYGSIPGNRPWPRPGPRTTVAGGGNIYSRQAPGGMYSYAVTQELRQIDEIVSTIVNAFLVHFGG
jgi:hypothetical protein